MALFNVDLTEAQILKLEEHQRGAGLTTLHAALLSLIDGLPEAPRQPRGVGPSRLSFRGTGLNADGEIVSIQTDVSQVPGLGLPPKDRVRTNVEPPATEPCEKPLVERLSWFLSGQHEGFRGVLGGKHRCVIASAKGIAGRAELLHLATQMEAGWA